MYMDLWRLMTHNILCVIGGERVNENCCKSYIILVLILAKLYKHIIYTSDLPA